MQWTLYALIVFMITTVFAHANDKRWDEWCTDTHEAQDWIDRYRAFQNGTASDLGDARATGEEIISEEFEMWCNSCAFSEAIEAGEKPRINEPMDVGGKAGYINATLSGPYSPPFGWISIGCFGQIVIFFEDHSNAQGYPVRGFAAFTVRKNPDPNGRSKLVATKLESELNDFARGLNSGFKIQSKDGRSIPGS
ncbi:hypothetical protein AC578_10249 [Pseudocercospora eumusae]|uniref:NTF2-like domain-containing protein n=1 Tax=Pseudocercospora eumusae TaxID=321146 RepID=A0A139HYQ8_9PEZI|nr:hypothetical protein AC578_10249 [Pseudocercospora eumusae]KXT07596.1 hypothetical protein AC578_10249 [Pseudocercospora eumusae]